MANDDTWVRLEDVATFVSGGTPSKAESSYWGGEIPWVSAKDMKTFMIQDTEDHITKEGLENTTRLVPPGTTLVLTRGMTLLNDVPICVSRRDVAFNQDIKALLPRDAIFDRYLTYAVIAAKPELLAAVDLAGHGTGRLPTDIFKSLRIRLPGLPEQRDIAHILGTLDEKLELNRRMTATLQAVARALFQSWFVDFAPVRAKASGENPTSVSARLGLPLDLLQLFPTALENSELGEVPEAWPVTTLGELCERVSMGPFGSDIKSTNFVPDGVPIIRGANLTSGFIDDNFVFLTDEKADELRNAIARSGDIVITHRGTLGQVGLLPPRTRYSRYVVSQSQMVLTVQRDRATPRFIYEFLNSYNGQHALLANTSQVGVPAIARPTTSVKAIRLICPPMQVLQAYEGLVEPLFERTQCALRESTALTAMRDSLLPKLLFGAVTVPLTDGA